MNATAEKQWPEKRGRETEPFFVDTSRGRVELAEYGEGPTVLFLHGAMGGYDQALVLARTLGHQGYRHLALSRPGYLGTPLRVAQSPEAQADLYAAVLDALGIQQTAVLAISGGGPSGIHFALRHPTRCWALILASTPAGKVNNKLPFSFKVMKALAHLPGMASAAQRKAQKQPELLAKRSITDEAILRRTIADAASWRLFQDFLLSGTRRTTRRFSGTENDVELTRIRDYPLETIAVPTLVVQGTHDPYVPFETNGKVFLAKVPAAKLVALEGGEHAAIFSHRQQAREQVGAFLQYHRPTP